MNLSRRSFLGRGAAVTAGLLLPGLIKPAPVVFDMGRGRRSVYGPDDMIRDMIRSSRMHGFEQDVVIVSPDFMAALAAIDFPDVPEQSVKLSAGGTVLDFDQFLRSRFP